MKAGFLPLCGIDEAGRGPLAGPLLIAGVILTGRIYKLNDSKLLSSHDREKLFKKIVSNSSYCIVRFSPKEIDERGLSYCIRKGLQIIKDALPDARYLFDGNSSFGVAGIETMVKADSKIKEVSAASILAKVLRDQEMEMLSKRYPEYGFGRHKGYGTREHIEAIIRYGRCDIHRRTFRIKQIDEPTLF